MSFLKKVCEVAVSGNLEEMSKAEVLIMNAFAKNKGGSEPLFAGEQRLTPDLAREVVNILYKYNISRFRMGDIGPDFPEILKKIAGAKCSFVVREDWETDKPDEILIQLR